jgi:hypothetical protein
MLMSLQTFSQGLRPIVQRTEKDTLYCFSTWQAKVLAQKLMAGVYCDSMAYQLEMVNIYLQESVINKERVNNLLETKLILSERELYNQQSINAVLLTDNTTLKTEATQKDKLIKKQRGHQALLSTALGVVIILVIFI